MTITASQMEDKLLTLDQVRERLAKTEPLSTDLLTSDTKIKFKLEPSWATTLEALDGTQPVDAFITINGQERQMTKDAALQAAANVGIPSAYVRKTPASLIETHLNYWYSGGMEDKAYNALSVNGNLAAFTRPSIEPYSNLTLLSEVLSGVQDYYGDDTQILADYKIMNTLAQTDIRLIVPEEARTIHGSNMNDVPEGGQDQWSAGIHFSNSLIGKSQTAVEAYLFRWWCTNGCTTNLAQAGTWNRKPSYNEMDMLEWARTSVDEVLGGLEAQFEQIQALTSLNVSGNTADIVREIFTDYQIPVSQRQRITDALLESETLTMYSIMNAITQTANEADLDPRRADKLMRIGGAIPTRTFDTLKAKVWREGHHADPTAVNPYEIAPVE